MALSDYLTSDEWDACFYAWRVLLNCDLGAAMRAVIRHLSQKGYEFRGVTADGQKRCQVANDNPAKLAALISGKDPGLLIRSFENGRNFLKQHSPDLVGELDEEWAKVVADLKGKHGIT